MSEGAGASGHAGLEEAFDELDAEVLAAMADTRAALMAEPSNAAGFRQVAEEEETAEASIARRLLERAVHLREHG